MGRHHRPDDDTDPVHRAQLVVTMRPTPAAPPAPVIEPLGPPAHLGWRGRRTARRQQAETQALAARIARAQRLLRQVSAPPDALPSFPAPRPAADAAPPWRSELPSPRESSGG
jgi:hypothetical protein